MTKTITLDQLKKITEGKKSQQKGSKFENELSQFMTDCGIHHIQIPQAAKIIKDRKTGRLLTIKKKLPFEFVIFPKNLGVYLVDAKTTKNLKMMRSYFIKQSLGKQESSQTQYSGMVETFDKTGFTQCGFVIRFGDQNVKRENIRFFQILDLVEIFKHRACITNKDGLAFNKWLGISD